MRKSKRQEQAILLIKRGILTTNKALNNSQRLALWHWKRGQNKNFEQFEMVK